MATYSVLPETLDIQAVSGDELSVFLDFSIDLTGYQFGTEIYFATVVNGQFTGKTVNDENFTITPVNLAEGTLNLSLTESQTESLTAGVSYRWFLRWIAPGVITRTVLSGSLTMFNP